MFTFRKPAALLLAASMLFSLCCCNAEDKQSISGYHINWMDSALFENIDQMKTKSVKDDFAAAANYEWASKQVEDYTYSISAFGEVMRQVVKNKRAILDDKSVQNKNVELLRIADGIFNDWDYRNAQGVEPLKKYMRYIDEIETIDDVSSYMIDNKKNPFAIALVDLSYNTNESLNDQRALMITKPELMLNKSDYYVHMSADAYKQKDKTEKRIRYVLRRCGYSDKDVNKIVRAGFGFETMLIHLDFSELSDLDNVHPMTEILEKAGSYPLADMLKHYKINSCDNISGDLVYLDKLENIYVQKNVDEMKLYFKARLALKSIRYLDKESNEFYLNSELDRSNPFSERHDNEQDADFFGMISKSILSAAMDQAYIDYYYDESVHDEVKDFVRQLKAKYKILINQSKLSEDSKKAVCDKLDKIGEKIMVPDNRADFTGVTFKPKEEGGTFLEILGECNRLKIERTGQLVQTKIDKDFWDIYDSDFSTTLTNAGYMGTTNTIYIYMGILVDPIYNHDYPIEKKLGSFVSVLGHELSHAFDSSGIYRDAEGKYKSLVSKDELDKWNEAAYRIEEHFKGYTPFKGSVSYSSIVDHSKETIADAEGLKACLMIGKDQKDFNYDLFFRSFAAEWRFLMSKQAQMEKVRTDVHPLNYIRINYTLMQFDEFYETYGIKPGDGMYMDPSERILVW